MTIDKKIENEILKIAETMGLTNTFTSNDRKYLVDYLNKRFPMLNDKKYSIGMKIYWLKYGINDFPKCANKDCTNKITSNKCYYPTGYLVSHCCAKCSKQDKNIIS